MKLGPLNMLKNQCNIVLLPNGEVLTREAALMRWADQKDTGKGILFLYCQKNKGHWFSHVTSDGQKY